jgi:serine/threonine protein phosphatase PrpC
LFLRFDAATVSDAGPRNVNEDEVSCWSPTEGELVGAIADGLGGMGGGSDASHIAIATLRRMLDRRLTDVSGLMAAAEQAHLDILVAQRASPQLRRMATTLTAGIFSQHGLVGVHCGVSRASIARAQGIVRLTRDHSEGERLFRKGKLTKKELLDYPRKNILDSALGIHDRPQIDTFEFGLVPGDKIFFTTDGVHGRILLREMREMAERHECAKDFVKEIAEAVTLRSPEDNFSILAVFVR